MKTLDVAKRLLDYGFHPPTIYFPLLVDEALMVEPTETETRESLDALAEAFESILAEAEGTPRSSATRPTRPRSAGSTRPRPAASRSCASRSAEAGHPPGLATRGRPRSAASRSAWRASSARPSQDDCALDTRREPIRSDDRA